MTSIMHFSKFLYIFNSITVCYVYILPVIMYLCDYLSLSVCFYLAKIDQAGGPEIFIEGTRGGSRIFCRGDQNQEWI